MANTNYNMYQAALALFNAAPQKTVTPAQLVATMGAVGMAQAPASKQAWKLGTLGFTITANKDGRNVVSYTMLAVGAAPAQKAVAAAKTAKVKAPKVAKVKAAKVKAPLVQVAKAAASKSPTAKKKVQAPAAAVMTDADIAAAAASIDIGDINELDDRSDLPDFLR